MQLHRRSFPLDLEIITLLRVLLGGGLRATGSTQSCQQAVRDGRKGTTKGAEDSPEVVVGELLQCVGLRLVLLLIKAHVGQIDGLSPLIGRHGHQGLMRRETDPSEGFLFARKFRQTGEICGSTVLWWVSKPPLVVGEGSAAESQCIFQKYNNKKNVSD